MNALNLLPYDYYRRRLQQRVAVIFVVLFVIVMAFVVLAALALERNARRTLAARDHIRRSYDEASRLIELMQRLEGKRATMLSKARLSATLLEKVPRSYLLAFVTNARPENVSLIQLEITSFRPPPHRRAANPKARAGKSSAKPDKPTAESPVIRISAEITGLAFTDVEVAKFIAALARNPLTDAVDLVYSKEKRIDERILRQFQIKWQLKGDADVFDVLGGSQSQAQVRRDGGSGPKETVGS